LKNADKSLDELINAVCSKGGTTIEAIKVYEKCGLGEITSKAVDACVKRSAELEKLL
jgi:pyrroline-5-carboxylate reductase